MSRESRFWLVVIVWALAIIALGLFSSCRTKYVVVPEYHNEVVTHRDTLFHRDSIYVKDSFYVEKKGDTVTIYKTKYIYIDKLVDNVVYRDSIKLDSIRVPYPVERQLSGWEKTVAKVKDFISLIFIFTVIFCLIRWLRVRSKG